MTTAIVARLSIIAATVMLAACASEPRTPGPPPPPPRRPAVADRGRIPRALLGDWRLERLNGSAITAAPGALNVPTMTIMANGSLTGTGGLNRWGAQVDVAGLPQRRFETTVPFISAMAGEPAAMALEGAFIQAMTDVRSYAIGPDTLTLFSGTGKELLVFRRRGA